MNTVVPYLRQAVSGQVTTTYVRLPTTVLAHDPDSFVFGAGGGGGVGEGIISVTSFASYN